MILAGDIGGTNVRLALFTLKNGQLSELARETYRCKEFDRLEAVVAKFLVQHPAQIQGACFGVAGPVKNGFCSITNLPWVISAQSLSDEFNIPTVNLINDLEANAYGLSQLSEDDTLLVYAGGSDAPAGNRAVISPGTGLGEAGILWDGEQYRPFPLEGGHTDFGPQTSLQFALAQHLNEKLGHVSYESVLCGQGLVNIYEFLKETQRGEAPDWLEDEISQSDPAAVISSNAVSGKAPICEQALDIFLTVLGQEAGNLALKTMATGGIWMGGGIPAKLAGTIKESNLFTQAFCNKGKMSHLLKEIPIRIVLNEHTALLGSAEYARLALSNVKTQTPSSSVNNEEHVI